MNAEQTKRTFIAVRFSEEVESGLARLEERLKRALRGQPTIKWVDPRNVHLTLQFLGDVDTGLFPKLAGGLKGAFEDVQPFNVVVSGLGAFPSLTRPRVLWTAFKSGGDLLKTLHACVLRVTEPIGFVPEGRSFSPHVTLGRLRESGGSAEVSKMVAEMASVEVGRCQIDRVHLVTSDLKPAGPVYTTIDSFELGR